MKPLMSKRKKEAWMRIFTMAKGKGVIKKIVAEQQKLFFFSRQKRDSDNAVAICEPAGVCFGEDR